MEMWGGGHGSPAGTLRPGREEGPGGLGETRGWVLRAVDVDVDSAEGCGGVCCGRDAAAAWRRRTEWEAGWGRAQTPGRPQVELEGSLSGWRSLMDLIPRLSA